MADTSAQDDMYLKNIVRDMIKKESSSRDPSSRPDAAASPSARAGVYDDFDEGDALGEGAYGKVWIGTRFDDGEKFAIKSIAGGDPNSVLTLSPPIRSCCWMMPDPWCAVQMPTVPSPPRIPPKRPLIEDPLSNAYRH